MKRSITTVLILLFLGYAGHILSAISFNAQDEFNRKQGVQEVQQQIEQDAAGPELKSDSPKLDSSKPDKPKLDKPKAELPTKRSPLKGSVQHQEMIKDKALSGGTGDMGGSGNGQLDGSARQGQMEGRAHKGGFRGRLSGANGPDEMGLGIIGVKFIMAFGRTPIIYEVFPGTPAAEAGMRPRDIILAVDGIPTSGLNKDEVYNMIVGQPNTMVTISFKRKSDFQIRQIERMDLNRIGDPLLRRDYLRM